MLNPTEDHTPLFCSLTQGKYYLIWQLHTQSLSTALEAYPRPSSERPQRKSFIFRRSQTIPPQVWWMELY